MNEERKIEPIGKRLPCGIDLPTETQKTDGELFVELLTHSRGESIALYLMLSREEPVNGIKSMPATDPPQKLLDLIESIIARYQAGEWAGSETAPETGSPRDEADSQEPSLNGIHPLNKIETNAGNSGASIDNIYYEGSLLWALTNSPDRPQDYHERYQGEEFITAQAIDAFLENATAEEIAAFNKLDNNWKR